MKKSAICMAVAAALCMVALFVNPGRYAQSIYDGLMLFVVSVVPSMLPFFFLSGILTGTGLAINIANSKVISKLYHAPDIGLYVMFMSLLGGYPTGAKLTAELYESNAITASGARKLVSFTSATGPMFLLGAVGTKMLGDYRGGLCILAAHYLATILNGLIYRGKKTSIEYCTIRTQETNHLLWDAAYNTAISLMIAGVFIIFFNMFADMMKDIGLISAIGKIASGIGIDSQIGEALAYGLCEMTRGCACISNIGLPIGIAAPLCCLVVTMGGIGVLMQSIAYLSKCKVPIGYYLLCKTTQSAMAVGLCFLFCLAL